MHIHHYLRHCHCCLWIPSSQLPSNEQRNSVLRQRMLRRHCHRSLALRWIRKFAVVYPVRNARTQPTDWIISNDTFKPCTKFSPSRLTAAINYSPAKLIFVPMSIMNIAVVITVIHVDAPSVAKLSFDGISPFIQVKKRLSAGSAPIPQVTKEISIDMPEFIAITMTNISYLLSRSFDTNDFCRRCISFSDWKTINESNMHSILCTASSTLIAEGLCQSPAFSKESIVDVYFVQIEDIRFESWSILYTIPDRINHRLLSFVIQTHIVEEKIARASWKTGINLCFCQTVRCVHALYDDEMTRRYSDSHLADQQWWLDKKMWMISFSWQSNGPKSVRMLGD